MILMYCRHPNVIGYKEAFFEEGSSSLCIVMEFADYGDLYEKILRCQKRGVNFAEEEIWKIAI
jgi:NIMA (never in mitosis gene a)-related kinase